MGFNNNPINPISPYIEVSTPIFSGIKLEINYKAEILNGVFPDGGSYDKKYRLLSQITLGNYMDE